MELTRKGLYMKWLDSSRMRSDAIATISDHLHEFLDWFQMQASLKLFATSLLIIYEGDSNQPIKSPDQLIDVRWVWTLLMPMRWSVSLSTLN